MKHSELPKFITGGKKSQAPKRSSKKRSAARGIIRANGDTGTPELKQRMLEADLAAMTPADLDAYRTSKGRGMNVGIAFEARSLSSTGQATEVGARVESQLPHDRYRVRNLLDPLNPWKNERYWDAAERLRRDFHSSGLAARMCSSFEPRVSGGDGALAPDRAIEAMKRYKKAMNSVGASLRAALWYVCISGQTTEEWATRNGRKPSEGIAVLRCGLAELAHFYGFVRIETIDGSLPARSEIPPVNY